MQEHVVDLQAVSSAKATAQHADEASAMLAAEVHQLQMEINAKQVMFLLCFNQLLQPMSLC